MCKPQKINKHDKTGRDLEFRLMSKGIGSCYIRPQMVDWHKKQTTSRVYVATDGDKKSSMPRYYKDKIYTTEDKTKISEHRRIQLESQAKRVSDVYKFQREVNEYKKAAYRKMYSKETIKNKL